MSGVKTLIPLEADKKYKSQGFATQEEQVRYLRLLQISK